MKITLSFTLLIVLVFMLLDRLPLTAQTDNACAQPPRLILGQQGRKIIASDTTSMIRDAASANAEILDRLAPGDSFYVVGGPVCNHGIAWWNIRIKNLIGWVAEGDGESNYWLELFKPNDANCTLVSRLRVGGMGRILGSASVSTPNLIRSQMIDGLAVGAIPAGNTFFIVDGPYCGDDDRWWWYVQYKDISGWTAEGEQKTNYWAEPVMPSSTFVCNPEPRLTIYASGHVISGATAITQTSSLLLTDDNIGFTSYGSTFVVLDGPVCDQNGIPWWYVVYNNIAGWVPEGDKADSYWLEPQAAQPFSCPDTLNPRLAVNELARAVRPQEMLPVLSLKSSIKTDIQTGDVFKIIGDPHCYADKVWWFVTYGRERGWVIESDAHDYWIEPY